MVVRLVGMVWNAWWVGVWSGRLSGDEGGDGV